MRLIIISGLSGSGKSVALNLLEDLGFYCIDNIPVDLLFTFVKDILLDQDAGYGNVAVGLDARNRGDNIKRLPTLIHDLRREENLSCDLVFLQAKNETLLSRFNETRRKHPLSNDGLSLPEAIDKERELLGPMINSADLLVDTTSKTIYDLRELIQNRVTERTEGKLSILLESFGYKHGLPSDADFVFDVRCLPNPYWESKLRNLNGTEKPVQKFLESQAQVHEMVDDIVLFLEHWIPRYQTFQRSYLTVAVGCTGGQHRSVFIAERVASRLEKSHGAIKIHHHEIPQSA
ncbi:MAG: RNase adapter RapZ [Pseudomonadota bacterium]|nr:RNase adapter RapZ [Pseudomonadota bacterium]